MSKYVLSNEEVQELLLHSPEILMVAEEMGMVLPENVSEEVRARLEAEGELPLSDPYDEYQYLLGLARENRWAPEDEDYYMDT